MKRNLIKAVGICFIAFVILSWIIPLGTYSGEKLTTSTIDPISFFDLAAIPISTIMTFIIFGVVFAVIGGFYGVIEETGVLATFVNKIRVWFKGKEKLFLVLTILHFVILSSLTGLMIPLFALVPLYAAIMFEMGYKNLTALASTVGAILLGAVGSTYGFNISGYTKSILNININDQILSRIILLVLITVVFTLFVVKTAKREENKNETKEVKKETPKEIKKEVKKEIKKETLKEVKKATDVKKVVDKKTPTKTARTKTTIKAKKTNGKSTAALAMTKEGKKIKGSKNMNIIPFIVIFSLTLIVAMVGMYNWYYAFEINWFNEIYENIMGIEIKDFPIFKHLLSGINQMGYWGNAEFATLLVIASGLIAWIYKLSLNRFVESFIRGVKAWMPTALYAALASIILCVLYQGAYSGNGTMVTTILAKTFGLADGFNVIITGVASLIGSLFYNDLYYLLTEVTVFTNGFDANVLPIAGLLIQSMYSVAMLLLPTSVLLIAGLSYFNVSFKQWFKYIWQIILILIIIILVLALIVAAI